MALPVQDQAFQQVRAAQERAVVGAVAADHDMVAAAGAGVATVDHELVGAQPGVAGFFIDRGGDRHAIVPVGGRVNIDLDDARIRCNADDVDALVLRRRIAFDMDRQAEIGRRLLGGGDQVEIILDALHRRHEDAQPPVARLDADARCGPRREYRHWRLRGSVPSASGALRLRPCGRLRRARAPVRHSRAGHRAGSSGSAWWI